jgi:cytochrome P450
VAGGRADWRCGTVGNVPDLPAFRPAGAVRGRDGFPLGRSVTRAGLADDPHPALALLRRHEPVSWLPALGGWLVTSRDLALRVLRDPATFTVDDPRFTTAQVVGPSMLSLDGAPHSRHRACFTAGFSRAAVAERLGGFAEAETESLLGAIRPTGHADLRGALAGPLSVRVVAHALGLQEVQPSTVLSWYSGIVGAVSALTGDPASDAEPAGHRPGVVTAGAEAFASLRAHLHAALRDHPESLLGQAVRDTAGAGTAEGLDTGGQDESGLTVREVISNAAVLMFGGIETTEGMIANALLHLLSNPAQLELVQADPSLTGSAVEESLRLEPAAAMVDRYATRDVRLGDAAVRQGDLVSVSLAGAGRDPATFPGPDGYDVRRPNAHQHLAFAVGPHFCLGAHLARLEAVTAVRAALRLPGLRLDPGRPSAPQGLVFRKPPALWVRWDPD